MVDSSKKPMRVFISQPMKGRTDEEILVERQIIAEHIEKEYKQNVKIIDSFFQNAPIDTNPLWFLGRSLELMSSADLVVFAEGWEEARGCRIEHACAELYGYKFKMMRESFRNIGGVE